MALGKYSPTVSGWYAKDKEWFVKNGGDFNNGNDHNSFYDNDGYDSYGYNEKEIDRAGVHENDYPCDEFLFENIKNLWYSKKLPFEKTKKLKP